MEQVDAVVSELRGIGEAHGGKTPSQVALAWLIAQGAVPIPGAKNRSQAEQNAGSLGWQMTEGELARLDAAALYGKRGIAQRVWQHG
jgi:aryl-alcohol dehydrogenase-like predicted oxidoreductase